MSLSPRGHAFRLLFASITPQMTCFQCANVCRKWLQAKVTIKNFQPDNTLIIGTKSENSELAMIAW